MMIATDIQTHLSTQELTLIGGTLGGENPLPCFCDDSPHMVLKLDASLTEEDRRYLGRHNGYRVLPYRLQDGYTRGCSAITFPCLVLENARLRAVVLPTLGGKLYSLYDKIAARELLYVNSRFQPANLALRQAWTSGGVEWNCGQLGHHYLTCAPVFAAQVDGEGYPVLRLYEFDRVRACTWQIDFHLPPDADVLYVHVEICNPHAYEIPMYWWSNIAVPETPGSRVLAPATVAIHPTAEGVFEKRALPVIDGVDVSYATRVRIAEEFFFSVPAAAEKWVACVEADGTGLFQTSTALLRGRKAFYWGMNAGGRRWQEFLNGPGETYIEIQAGLTQTQLETLPMPGHTTWAWTEVYGRLALDPAVAHGEWGTAGAAAAAAIAARVPTSHLQAIDKRAAALASCPPQAILHVGSGWGALEARRRVQCGAPPLPAGLAFPDATLGDEQAPWLQLLTTGRFPAGDETTPSWMVQSEWRELLQASLRQTDSCHWLAALHLGVMAMEAWEEDEAQAMWQSSLTGRRCGLTLRNLAVAARRRGQQAEALRYYAEAWQVGPRSLAFAQEYATYLAESGEMDTLGALLSAADFPAEYRGNDRIRIARARYALARQAWDEVETCLLDVDFPTIREGETVLTDLWFALQQARRRQADDDASSLPDPPRAIDFRRVDEVPRVTAAGA